MLKPIEASFQFKTDAARTRPVVVVDNKIMLGGVAEDTDVDIQPITRADFVPAKVFRSRSMNTPPGSILARQQLRAKTKSLTFPPLSIARYSFIQLSEQGRL